MLIGIIGLLVVFTAIIWAVIALIRFSIREGEGLDPRWGMVGTPESGSELAAMSARVFAVPTPAALVVRSSPNREASWEREYPWSTITVAGDDGQVLLRGPFGLVRCTPGDSDSISEALGRMRRL
ncbi:MAG: hypothetical protein PHU75_07995 [Candidatus Nanopelagicales bacterium]|nr:hypothetical protein [Candidatus Nanopelagicales bacterium]